MTGHLVRTAFATFGVALISSTVVAQGSPTAGPARRANEGRGPFNRLVIQNAMVIDGTGAPARGPINITIEGNRITAVGGGGGGGRGGRGAAPAGDVQTIDARGMYVMPGLVDMHVHAGGAPKNEEAEYAYKLWLAHGVTTVRGVSLGPNAYAVSDKERSAKNEIVAPLIYNYQLTGSGWDQGGVDSPE